MKYDCRQFYIGGEWVEPLNARDFPIISPVSEQQIGTVALASVADVDRAVAAAVGAFPSWAATEPAVRRAVLERVLGAYKARQDAVATAISTEMGAPMSLATSAQAASGLAHIAAMLEVLKRFEFEYLEGRTRIVLEPIGVCGLITPWNWPVNQIACKVVPALAAGCTMVLKPSEIAPLSAVEWTLIMADARVPPGVFNLVHGDGPEAGAALASHADLDMVSFTGSTRAGAEVARNGAKTIKRVHQELGGKSPNILLDDADFDQAVKAGVLDIVQNTGQSCNAPSRMLVPVAQLERVEAIAKAVLETVRVGDPADPETQVGPLVSKTQFQRVQALIDKGIAEGARLIAGGPGRPAGLHRGWFVRPTVFSSVSNDMTIAREEIFGPVLAIIPYQDEEEAVRIANDTPYGLSAYVWSRDTARAQRIARRMRAGMVHINGAPLDNMAPFGGYKMSGNGREWGAHGLREFLEVKAVMGGIGP
jgi:aldehyde dehydrogenase (NAD+)